MESVFISTDELASMSEKVVKDGATEEYVLAGKCRDDVEHPLEMLRQIINGEVSCGEIGRRVRHEFKLEFAVDGPRRIGAVVSGNGVVKEINEVKGS